MLLKKLKPDLRAAGLIPSEDLAGIRTAWHGTDALELTYKTTVVPLGQQEAFRKDDDNSASPRPATVRLIGRPNFERGPW